LQIWNEIENPPKTGILIPMIFITLTGITVRTIFVIPMTTVEARIFTIKTKIGKIVKMIKTVWTMTRY
jgi:hypothetical protein